MNFLPFLSEVIKIKKTVRSGWRLRNVPEPESVADHMYFMSLMALVMAHGGENGDRGV